MVSVCSVVESSLDKLVAQLCGRGLDKEDALLFIRDICEARLAKVYD